MVGGRRNRGRAHQRNASAQDDAAEDESHDEAPNRHQNLQDIDARLRDQDRELTRQVQTLV